MVRKFTSGLSYRYGCLPEVITPTRNRSRFPLPVLTHAQFDGQAAELVLPFLGCSPRILGFLIRPWIFLRPCFFLLYSFYLNPFCPVVSSAIKSKSLIIYLFIKQTMKFNFIIIIILRLNARRSPMSHIFLTR